MFCDEQSHLESKFTTTSFGWSFHKVVVFSTFISLQLKHPPTLHLWLSFLFGSSLEKADLANNEDAMFTFLLSATISLVSPPNSSLISFWLSLSISLICLLMLLSWLMVKIICFVSSLDICVPIGFRICLLSSARALHLAVSISFCLYPLSKSFLQMYLMLSSLSFSLEQRTTALRNCEKGMLLNVFRPCSIILLFISV